MRCTRKSNSNNAHLCRRRAGCNWLYSGNRFELVFLPVVFVDDRLFRFFRRRRFRRRRRLLRRDDPRHEGGVFDLNEIQDRQLGRHDTTDHHQMFSVLRQDLRKSTSTELDIAIIARFLRADNCTGVIVINYTTAKIQRARSQQKLPSEKILATERWLLVPVPIIVGTSIPLI